MVTSAATSTPEQSSIPPALVKVCFVLCVINLSYFPTAYFADLWMYQADGLGVPTDFVNVWAAGRLVLEGHPALAYDWDIQKQVELALLKQDFAGYSPGTIRRHSYLSLRCWRGFLMPWPSSAGLCSASFPISP